MESPPSRTTRSKVRHQELVQRRYFRLILFSLRMHEFSDATLVQREELATVRDATLL